MAQPTDAQSHMYDRNDNPMIGDQGASVADPTDLATSITAIKAILDRLEAHGLIADV